MFETPILFLVFNRPDVTAQVFAEIKKQKPKYLYVAADGARPNNDRDNENCKLTRLLVTEGIDWDCEVKTLFRDENLGCGIAVSDAITWFFENVEQGIILEDDCLPHASFFGFCETLLEKYKNDKFVYGITGNNFQDGIIRGESSYYFSNYPHIWGWASWRRAWKDYDYKMEKLDKFEKSKNILRIDNRKIFADYWFSVFKRTANKEINTWDCQWVFAVWDNEGLIATPNVNLISNIGFGEDATHTKVQSVFANMASKNIGKIIHPEDLIINKKADRYVSNTLFGIRTNILRVSKSKVKVFLKRLMVKK